jgi:hypothetical protein
MISRVCEAANLGQITTTISQPYLDSRHRNLLRQSTSELAKANCGTVYLGNNHFGHNDVRWRSSLCISITIAYDHIGSRDRHHIWFQLEQKNFNGEFLHVRDKDPMYSLLDETLQPVP